VYFLVSLLLHLLLLFSLGMVWVYHPKVHKSPSMYVPSYTYNEPAKTYAPPEHSQQKVIPDKSSSEKQAISTATQIRHASQSQTNTSTKITEAIHLVGDKKSVPKPLIKLLGKALTAHLIYPKIAIDFKLHGIAYVAFILHSDGTLTNVQLVQSSRAGVLDDEAVTAVSAISPLQNVSPYVEGAKPMVVGIIFN
jgi:TonB family protein